MSNRDEDRLCKAYTDGVKLRRVWLHPPRPCRNYRLRGFEHCRQHISGQDASRWWRQRQAGNTEAER